jgi:hypothetical protein
MDDEYQELKAAYVKTLMRMRPDQLVTHNGRRQPASDVLRSMLRGEEASIHKPADQPDAASRAGAPSLSPSNDAIASLSDEHRAALESGEGISGFTRPVTPTVRTSQDDGSHGTTRVSFHFTPEGVVEPGVTPESQKGQMIKPVIGTEQLAGATRIRMIRDE